MKNNKVLEINNLSIAFQNGNEQVVVDDLSFSLKEGEILGIVGESGSGKTMSSLAIMDLLPSEALIKSGTIRFMDKDLLSEDKESRRRMKGKMMTMVFQEPMTSLNPVLKIGYQVEEVLRLHESLSKEEYKRQAMNALAEVELKEIDKLYHQYPHQISGGMRQRVMIAMAMISKPKLLIADEPTTALDVTTQHKILSLLKKINEKSHTSMILISHNLKVIQSICDNVIVMKDGVKVEEGRIEELFKDPKEEYTRNLISASLISNTGEYVQASHISDEAKKKNFHIEESNKISTKEILKVDNLSVYYDDREKNIFKKKKKKLIVDKVSFHIKQGEIFGIVGESGCGKSTLAKAIVGLNNNIEGSIDFHNGIKSRDSIPIKPQMVFQDPYSSLNPCKKVDWIVEEPLKVKTNLDKEARRERVKSVIEMVGLKEKHLTRYASQLSGGQRQRVAIAQAIILNPKLIILDEAVSSLDATVQMQILELLKKLKVELGLSYLFISHDLNVVRRICDRVGVMQNGRIIEINTTEEIFNHAKEEYTKKLLV